MTDTDRIAELEAKIARLESIIDRLDDRPSEPEPAMPLVRSEAVDAPTSRRRLLRNMAIATGGAVAATVATNTIPAAAVYTGDLQLGLGPIDNLAGATTHARLDSGTAPTATAFVFETGNVFTATGSPAPSALGGWTSRALQPNGVSGYSIVANGTGVVGIAESGAVVGVRGIGATGVAGSANAAGGTGTSGTAGSGVGVIGTSSSGAGVRGTSTSSVGVIGNSVSSIGVFGGGSAAGVSGDGTVGVTGAGSTYALSAPKADGAALFLSSATYTGAGTRSAPPLRLDAHVAGEIDVDANQDLWVCVVSGTPGTWRKLAGPTTGGAFHPVTPGRVYDSRVPVPAPGSLATGATRTISVSSRRELGTGNPVEPDFVPAGATAISCNITVVETQGSGFLAINPGGTIAVSAAAINWSTNGQILNNGVILRLNDERQLTVIGGGGGTTQFVVDVTGYFR